MKNKLYYKKNISSLLINQKNYSFKNLATKNFNLSMNITKSRSEGKIGYVLQEKTNFLSLAQLRKNFYECATI